MARKTAKNYSSESEPESEDNSLSSSKIRKCSFANQNGTKENTFPLIVKLEESTPNGIKTDVDNQITERHTEVLRNVLKLATHKSFYIFQPKKS